MNRFVLASLVLLAVAGPGRLAAQQQDVQEQTYRERRNALMNELQQAQQQLDQVRGERVQLQSRIENVIAQVMQQRAQTLLLSNETNSLQQLDAVLTASQDNLLSQRDRFAALGEAVKRRSGAVLVVLLRADSTTGTPLLSQAALSIDNAAMEPHSYSVTANSALRMGAVDQLYRSNVLPTPHVVTLQVTVDGQPLTQTVNVNAQGQAVTYVQFAVRNGQLIPTTWTSQGTTPF